jgi:hypothetical protein
MLPMLAGGVLSLGSSLFGGRSARRAAQRAEDQARQRQAQIQGYNRDALGRSQAFSQTMPDGTAFTPWNIQTGRGGWEIDPATGQATARLSQPNQAMQDWQYRQSQEARNQLGNFDRNAFAQQEYNRGQGLLAEGRGQQMSDMMGMLQRKGLAGFGQTNAIGGTAQTNPLLATLFDRQNRQDLELMDRSFGAGDAQMDRLYGRATGLFDRADNMNTSLDSQLQRGMQYGEADRQRGLDDFRMRAGLFDSQEALQRGAALGGMEDVGTAQNMGNQARYGASMGMSQSFGNIGNLMMGGGMNGMFSPQQMPFLRDGAGTGAAYGNQDYGRYF